MLLKCNVLRTLLPNYRRLFLVLAAPLALCACGAGGATHVGDTSISLERPRDYLPTDRDSLRRNTEPPIKGTLPLGIGAQVNLFLSEADEQIDGFIGNVVKPMRTGEVFAAKPYQLDYAIRDRGDTFRNDVALDRVSFRSHYDIRIGMTRRFHNFGDMLDPGFWLGVGRFTPTPTNNEPEKPKPIGPLFRLEDDLDTNSNSLEILPNRPIIDMDEALGRNKQNPFSMLDDYE
jgi:hypothetical protein